MKVVLDSNVLLAAFGTKGTCEAVLAATLAAHELIISEPRSCGTWRSSGLLRLRQHRRWPICFGNVRAWCSRQSCRSEAAETRTTLLSWAQRWRATRRSLLQAIATCSTSGASAIQGFCGRGTFWTCFATEYDCLHSCCRTGE
jgi:hypothetical protein